MQPVIAYLWVAAGSALGGMARFGFGLLSVRLWGQNFPWGTIAINVIGSFIISFFGTLTLAEGLLPASPNLRTFVMVGICGGFTTFSSFSLQTLDLARGGNWFGAAGNVGLSVFLCLLSVTLGHISADRLGTLRSEASTMSAHILAVLNETQTAHPVLAAAALAAERLGEARIEALHIRHDAMEGFMPTEEVMTEERRREIDGRADRHSADLHDIFEGWRQDANTGTWRVVTGETIKVIAAEEGADLIVLGRPVSERDGEAREAIHAALFHARAPTLLVPHEVPTSLGRHIAVAWKPSEAAERAVEAAMPLLRRADQVTVLTEIDDSHKETKPAGLLAQLKQANVPSRVHLFQAGGRGVGEALLAEARGVGADLMVMGAYTHSRVAEWIFGGATREVLAEADLPVLMHH